MSDTLFPDHEGYFQEMSPVAASYVQSQHGKPNPLDGVAQARQAEFDQQQGQSMPLLQLLSTGSSPESSSSISAAGDQTQSTPSSIKVEPPKSIQEISNGFTDGINKRNKEMMELKDSLQSDRIAGAEQRAEDANARIQAHLDKDRAQRWPKAYNRDHCTANPPNIAFNCR